MVDVGTARGQRAGRRRGLPQALAQLLEAAAVRQ
jgi:hypothetical protein